MNSEQERMRQEYSPKAETSFDQAVKLDKKVKLPAVIMTYSIGIISALVLGIGMCLAMKVIGDGSALSIGFGIAIGIVGIIGVVINYPLYNKVLSLRKKKYAGLILAYIDEEKK